MQPLLDVRYLREVALNYGDTKRRYALMVDEVKKCVDAKINFFEEFFSVPNDLKSEMEMFIKDTHDLGEKCSSASEFEEQFYTSELLNRFNTLV